MLFSIKGNSWKYNIYLASACIIAFFTPDYILKLNGMSHVQFELIFTLVFFLFGLILSMCNHQKVVYTVVSILFILEMLQLHYMAYFGEPITSPEIKKIIVEQHDIIESGLASFASIWYVLPAMFISYGSYLYLYRRYSTKAKHFPLAYVLLIILLLAKPDRARRKSLKDFMPGPTRNSIHNTLNTFSYFFVKGAWDNNIQPHTAFLPYKITQVSVPNNTPDIVILWIMESATYTHMSLYGYERPTTPLLDQLKDTPNFIHRKAVSASVSTSSSLPLFLNTIREAGNLSALYNGTANLFRLAKQAGYYTTFYSSQESKLLNHLGVKYLDKIITRDNRHSIFLAQGDDYLLKLISQSLNNIKKHPRQFIVIMQRNLHSPYQKNYRYHLDMAKYEVSNSQERKTNAINGYDNAMLYEDVLLSQLIYMLRDNPHKASVIFTSDHGQLLGENNQYGHNILDFNTAKIPFMAYYNDVAQKELPGLIQTTRELPEFISHYEIAKFIASLLGYHIDNPNEDGTFVLQDNNIYGNNFILPFRRSSKTHEIIPLPMCTVQ